MQHLEVPVYDDGLGEYINRRVAVIGCLAQDRKSTRLNSSH